MSCTAKTLAGACPSIEAELQLRLRGFLGGFLRAYLPQSWVFRTEQDAATLVVDAAGHARAEPSAMPTPDVTVELPHGELGAVLASRGGHRPAPGTVKVTAHTAKGRAAVGYLGPRLGL